MNSGSSREAARKSAYGKQELLRDVWGFRSMGIERRIGDPTAWSYSTGSPIALPSSTSRSSRIGFGSESWTSLPRPEILRAR